MSLKQIKYAQLFWEAFWKYVPNAFKSSLSLGSSILKNLSLKNYLKDKIVQGFSLQH